MGPLKNSRGIMRGTGQGKVRREGKDNGITGTGVKKIQTKSLGG